MRCVSYTRSISGCPVLEPPKNAVGQQNEAIREYIKRKGWKLEQKYSDRKMNREEDAAFLATKKDGMERKFDCVVVDSMFYCGKNITAAVDVLYTIFYPFGIHFAVVEDDFCSADVSDGEVEAYLQQARSDYRAEIASKRATLLSEGKAYSKYGYVWVEDEKLVIDPEAAAIVKEIFELSASGKSALTISRLFNERGLENPKQHRYRMLGKDTSGIEGGWKTGTVQNLMKKKMFTGEWERCVRGKSYTLPCPVIVEPSLFEKARKARDKRSNLPKTPEFAAKEKIVNPFAKMIWDHETDHGLNVYVLTSSRERIFRFRYPAPKVTGYEHYYKPYAEVEREVMLLLAKEKKKAQFVRRQMETGNAAAEKERQQQMFREKALTIYKRMTEIERELMEDSRAYESESMDEQEYRSKRERLLAKQNEYDHALWQNIDAIKELEKAFSLQNPWLRLFEEYPTDAELTKTTVKKYLEAVRVYRFETVGIVTKQQEWREKLPKEWFTDLGVD